MGQVLVRNLDNRVIESLRTKAELKGRSLEQELRAILDMAGDAPEPAPLPPIRLATVRTTGNSSWSREEIYDDEGR